MNLICPASYKVTTEDYASTIAKVIGEANILKVMIDEELSLEALETIQSDLSDTIYKIQELQDNLELDLLDLEKSRLFCCSVNNQRIFNITNSLLDTGLFMIGGLVIYNTEEVVSKAAGIVFVLISQMFSKANDFLSNRSKELSKRKMALKDRLSSCSFVKRTINEANELCLSLIESARIQCQINNTNQINNQNQVGEINMPRNTVHLRPRRQSVPFVQLEPTSEINNQNQVGEINMPRNTVHLRPRRQSVPFVQLEPTSEINNQNQVGEVNMPRNTVHLHPRRKSAPFVQLEPTSEINNQNQVGKINMPRNRAYLRTRRKSAPFVQVEPTSEINNQNQVGEINMPRHKAYLRTRKGSLPIFSQDPTSEINNPDQVDELNMPRHRGYLRTSRGPGPFLQPDPTSQINDLDQVDKPKIPLNKNDSCNRNLPLTISKNINLLPQQPAPINSERKVFLFRAKVHKAMRLMTLTSPFESRHQFRSKFPQQSDNSDQLNTLKTPLLSEKSPRRKTRPLNLVIKPSLQTNPLDQIIKGHSPSQNSISSENRDTID